MSIVSVVIDPAAHTGLDKVQVASLLVGVFIPILVGLVTKKSTTAAVKSLLLLGLSGATAFFTEYVNSANFVWQQALLTAVVTFTIGVATYYGLWKNTVTDQVQGMLIKDAPAPTV